MITKDYKIPSTDIKLAGTLVLPDHVEHFPIVILLPGSGTIDRNENSKKLRLNLFADIAHCFCQQGIATFRYDKRGVGESGGQYFKTGFHDNIEDAKAIFNFIKHLPESESSPILLLGHSEGAIIATHLAAELELAGVILLAGTAQSGEAVLKWQLTQILGGISRWQKFILKLFRLDPVKAQQKKLDKIKYSTADTMKFAWVKTNAKWLREMMAYDPAIDFPKIKAPILAITGSKDIQVPPDDLKRMQQLARAPIQTYCIENLTHIIRKDIGVPSIASYTRLLQQPCDQETLDIMVDWIKHNN